MKRASLPPLDAPVYPAGPKLLCDTAFIVSMDGCDIYRMGAPAYTKSLGINWPLTFVVHYRRSPRAYAEYRPQFKRWVVTGRLPDKSPHPRPKEISQRVETYLDALHQLES